MNNIISAILCGGTGSRLRPLTYYFQKSMIPIGSKQKPLLEYIIKLLKFYGIYNIVLLVGYKHEQIINYFEDGKRFNINIKYIHDKEGYKGNGWAILNAYEQNAFNNFENILIYYGDILSNIDLSKMIEQHIKRDAIVTLAVSKGYKLPIGIAKIDNMKIIEIKEKPIIDVNVGIGILLLKKEALEILKNISEKYKNIELDLMSHLLPYLIKMNKKVDAYITDCFWYDVGSIEKYEKLDSNIIDNIFDFIFEKGK
ncbi:MAG: nucleotidyltransferase family protein [Candidatus Methanomethylicaceae archaeon]